MGLRRDLAANGQECASHAPCFFSRMLHRVGYKRASYCREAEKGIKLEEAETYKHEREVSSKRFYFVECVAMKIAYHYYLLLIAVYHRYFVRKPTILQSTYA